jgi:membrane associated rhomboid family serine protease
MPREPLDNDRKPVAQTAKVNALTMSGWILAINVVIFFLGTYVFRQQNAVDPTTGIVYTVPSKVDAELSFSYATAVQHYEVWRFFTFQFVHANFAHIAGNMIALMSLGPVIEEYLGRRRFLAFYLLCGCTGPIAFLILSAIWPQSYPASSTLVGASAGVFGVLVGAAMVAPDDWVELIFPPTPVKLRTMAIIMLAVAVYTVFAFGGNSQHNAGGEAAHLGGAAMGWYLIRKPERLDWAETVGPKKRWHPR